MFGQRFAGGVDPPHNKPTAGMAIRHLPRPERVVIPLRQHIGAPCRPLVKVGEQVARGQPVGDTEAPVAAPVHASLGGKVVAIETRLTPGGRMEPAVVIEAGGDEEWWSGLPNPLGWDLDPEAVDPAEIRQQIRMAGLVGLGGAGFPTATKLAPRAGTPAPDVVLLNGAECEPVLTSDHRLMLEEPGQVVLGLRLLMQAVGARRGIIAVEANKADAAQALQREMAGDPRLAVEMLPVRYPQGAEKMLVWAVLRRKVPLGGFPLDVGVVVQNVATAAAVALALAAGYPLVERIVTVDGQVSDPGNWRVPIGTLCTDLVAAAGGVREPVVKVIIGGPMMGFAQPSLEVPVTKTAGGLILLGAEARSVQPEPCIRCGRCVAACPMGLVPVQLARAAEAGQWSRAGELHIGACMECGSCSFVCPARRPLVQAIRLAKAQIARARSKAAGTSATSAATPASGGQTPAPAGTGQ